MRRFPLCVIMVVWGRLCLGCDTGVAYPGQSLSLYRSSLANADVALLKSYHAADVNGCMNDCCTEKYGSCSVASFKKNTTDENCQLFNCQPVQKCMFTSSSSNTDSFSFSSSLLSRLLVPSSSSRHASNDNSSFSNTTTSTSTDEPIALKNDNTSVKPRKGVDEGLKDIFGNDETSGVKPRKGVEPERGGVVTSKVKPRKGVGPQPSSAREDLSVPATSSEGNVTKAYQDIIADDLASALERVFQDDVKSIPSVTSSKDLVGDISSESSAPDIRQSSSVGYSDVTPTRLTTLQQATSYPTTTIQISSSLETTSSGLLLSSLATSRVATSSVRTPYLQTTGVAATGVVSEGTTPTPSSPTILEHSRLIFHEVSDNIEDSESERKYKSSMHLVLSLVFGLLILVSVLGVVAKRVYDSWMRRHYRRMDFLIDGMYNAYE